MLSSLQIKNFAIIKQTELTLDSGLTVLTGETGAGKSILLDAMGLVLGDRADSTMVRHGAAKADISAWFDIDKLPSLKAQLEEMDLEDDDNQCMIRRVISKDGKSKAYINGIPATLAQLKQIGQQLVDIHGQHDHQLLSQTNRQLIWLDEQLDSTDLLQQLKHSYQQWHHLQQQLQQLQQQHQQAAEDLERYQFQLNELQALDPKEDEIEALEQEHKQQANAEQLISLAQQSYEQLYQQNQSVLEQLNKTQNNLQKISRLDANSQLNLQGFEQSIIEIEETANTLKQYLNQLDIDPMRLEYLENRLASYQNLAFKHQCLPEELYQKQQALLAKVEQLQNIDENLDELQQQVEKSALQYRTLAKQLSDKRQKKAQELSQSISDYMQQLSMKGGQFQIEVSFNPEQAFSAKGQDTIRFMVSANPGQPLKELKKVASGGELSRISLAMQLVGNSRSRVPTLIFDEIDAGIGGKTANTVGALLHQLGENTQSLCVTHLPQVAAKGHHHMLVSKTVNDEQTETHLHKLDSTQRVNEIARMLSGTLTDNSLQHARELLQPNDLSKT